MKQDSFQYHCLDIQGVGLAFLQTAGLFIDSPGGSLKDLPWVPEPQNLNEMKLVRGKERRKKGGSGQMITQPRFGADQHDYESIRSPFAQ